MQPVLTQGTALNRSEQPGRREQRDPGVAVTSEADFTEFTTVFTSASLLTLASDPVLGAERVLTPASGELVGTDGGANAPYTLGLADTTVTAGSYGDATHVVSLTIDAKGRITGASESALSTSNVTEGTNLYYTDARARAALSGVSGISYNSATGEIALDASGVTPGTYASPTSITVDAYGRITAIS